MISDYYVNLHFNQAIAQRTGYAFKIGDKGCTFHFHCEDLDPSGMYPHIVFNHPNNTCVEGVPTGSGRDYAYTIQGNEFAVIGKTVVDLKFYDALDATQRISTASFIIEILPDTYTPFEEASSSYADSLERAREEIDAAILELQGAEHDLEEAETDLGNMSEQFADTLQDYIDAFGNTGPINPRGEYDPNEQYVPRDAVQYTAGGKTLTYINGQTCTGIAPTDPDHGAEHWQIMIDVSVGGSFSALSDVSVDPQTLADGQVPVYNDTDDVWENKSILENSLSSTATNKALTAAKGKELQDNKQDKELETPIIVAGTSKTTVEGALDGINAYVDDTVEAAFDIYGAKNGFDEKSAFVYNVTNNNGVFTNIIADARHYVDLYIVALDSAYYPTTLVYAVLTSTGNYSYDVTIPSGTKYIDVKHNSSTADQGARFNVSMSGACKVSFRLLGADPSTVGGFSFDNAMLCDARVINPTFVPYAMTNKQLTEVIQEEDISSQISVNTTYFNPGALIAYKKMCNGLKWLHIYAQPITTVPNDTAFMSGFTPDAIYKVCIVYNITSGTKRFTSIWTNNLGQLMIGDNLSTDDILIYNDITR